MLPEAVVNYLLRLGWSHGDDEIITLDDAVRWFDLDGVGASPSRFDLAKLESLNAHYLRDADPARLARLVADRLERDEADLPLLMEAMPHLTVARENAGGGGRRRLPLPVRPRRSGR